MNVLKTSDLGKRYRDTWALRECTLEVPAGHLAALVGPNGAGKTTLMNITAGLAVPTTGTATCWQAKPPDRRPRWTEWRSSRRTRRCTGTCPLATCCISPGT
jgi:ABC-type multidrug transport system ATPase subunit